MPNNLNIRERECLWCQKLITGRSDKKFCNTSCKSHYQRAAPLSPETVPELPPLSAHAMIIAQALFAYDSWRVLRPNHSEEELDKDNNVIEGSIIEVPRDESYEHYLKVRRYQEKLDSMHAPYADVIEAYLDNTHDCTDIKLIDYHIKKVVEAIDMYVRHTGLDTPGHIAHYRLSNLYLIYHHLQSQRRQVVGCHSRNEYASVSCIGGYLLSRHQSYLWGNLLGID